MARALLGAPRPADLLDRPKSGRKPSLSPSERERLAEILEQEPKEYGYQSHGWTVPLLLTHLEMHEGVSLSGSTLRRTLRAMGFRWKRPRYVLARKDPERAEKKAALLERIRALPKHTVVLFCDESLLREFPPLPAAWAKKGEQARVAITGNNARRTLFGVLNPRTGKRLLMTRIRNRAEDFQAFLRHIRAQYRRWDIFLLLDQASSHTARKTRALAEKLRIEFAFLPTACPELNPTELLWRRGKDHESANRVYPKVQEQVDAFVDHLLSMSNRQALQTTGCLSDNFWLSTLGGRDRILLPSMPSAAAASWCGRGCSACLAGTVGRPGRVPGRPRRILAAGDRTVAPPSRESEGDKLSSPRGRSPSLPAPPGYSL